MMTKFRKRTCTELNGQTGWRVVQVICVFHEVLNDTGTVDRTKRPKPHPSTRWLLILLFISVSNMTKTMIDLLWFVSNFIQGKFEIFCKNITMLKFHPPTLFLAQIFIKLPWILLIFPDVQKEDHSWRFWTSEINPLKIFMYDFRHFINNSSKAMRRWLDISICNRIGFYKMKYK